MQKLLFILEKPNKKIKIIIQKQMDKLGIKLKLNKLRNIAI